MAYSRHTGVQNWFGSDGGARIASAVWLLYPEIIPSDQWKKEPLELSRTVEDRSFDIPIFIQKVPYPARGKIQRTRLAVS